MEERNRHTSLMQCPNCRSPIDRASVLDKEQAPMPQDGDYTVCLYCNALLQYAGNVTRLDGVTVDELVKMEIEEPEMFKKLFDTLQFTTLFQKFSALRN